ncbi:hypothetical protein [Sporosarcina sp. FSL W7-1283]|uniref:hypothetical protein n=1 Tax=Sporosarcina sp. FSL W7-1283 TaxID=2921560 RepID=UPI0030FA0F1F
MINRYAIKMKNGTFLSLPFYDVSQEHIWAFTVGLPVDAELFKTKNDAEMFLKDILNGGLSILVGFEDSNPPFEVVELEVNYQVK